MRECLSVLRNEGLYLIAVHAVRLERGRENDPGIFPGAIPLDQTGDALSSFLDVVHLRRFLVLADTHRLAFLRFRYSVLT